MRPEPLGRIGGLANIYWLLETPHSSRFDRNARAIRRLTVNCDRYH